MSSLVLAAAQAASVPGDITANVARHLRFAETAAARGVGLLVFPELSLTGYELATAARDAIMTDDLRLQPLRDVALASGMTIIAGAPLRAQEGLHLGALILHPDGTVSSYAKMHLHDGEDAVFQPGVRHVCCTVGNMRVVPAICADIGRPSHPEVAAGLGAQVYAAGVLITEGGIVAETAMMESYARSYGMVAVMANHAAPSGGFVSAGSSAIWAGDGHKVADAQGAGDALVIGTVRHGVWAGEIQRF
jgi:predicted amidohydrolase